MEDLWTKINNDVPRYMKKICEKYEIICVKLSPIKTALIGDGYALIISFDRFEAKVSYLQNNGKENILFLCDNYMAEKYNAEDRNNLLEGNGAEILVRNNLIIIANGLESKWHEVLNGDTKWIDDYKKSKWYAVGRLTVEESEIINRYI